TPVAGNAYYALESVSYAYEDPSNPNQWTTAAHDTDADGTVDVTCVRHIEDSHPVSSQCQATGAERPSEGWTYAYENGVLARAESDQQPWSGADGTPDIRYTWSRDDRGRLTGFQQDGTYHDDNPVIDGVADFGETYSAGCEPLIESFPWL